MTMLGQERLSARSSQNEQRLAGYVLALYRKRPGRDFCGRDEILGPGRFRYSHLKGAARAADAAGLWVLHRVVGLCLGPDWLVQVHCDGWKLRRSVGLTA